MRATKRSHLFIPWPILPPPSRAEVDCGVFEVYEQADPLKWAARLPIGHALPTPKAWIFSYYGPGGALAHDELSVFWVGAGPA